MTRGRVRYTMVEWLCGSRRQKLAPTSGLRYVQSLLRSYLESLPGENAWLFPDAWTFYRYFKLACEDLGLSSDFVPHSLRHGGATHDYLKGLPIEDIMRLGRWIYIQSGRAILLSNIIPREVVELAKVLVPHIVFAFSLTQ